MALGHKPSGESEDEPILMGEELTLTGVLNGENLNIDTDIDPALKKPKTMMKKL